MVNVSQRLAAIHYPRNKNVFTIVDADEDEPATYQVQIPSNQTTAFLRQKIGQNWQNVAGAAVTLAQANQFDTIMGYTYAAHRDVLVNNAQWRAIYNVANRALFYIDHTNAQVHKPGEDSVPCHDCGLVCRLDATITIDHQRPQAGNELEPVCKVFRAMGLTIDGPTGRKGTHGTVAGWPAAVGGLASANVGTLNAKYTLNNIGKIYYTLIQWSNPAGNYRALVEDCMNHIMNLRPLCSACNSPNRNVRHF